MLSIISESCKIMSHIHTLLHHNVIVFIVLFKVRYGKVKHLLESRPVKENCIGKKAQ